MSSYVKAVRLLVLCAFLGIPAAGVHAAANWGVDLGNSNLNIMANTYADSAINGFDPGPHYADAQLTNVFVPGFINGPDTFDLGAALNPLGNDEDLSTSPPTITSASSVGIITIDGIGGSTLEINWRANTLNDFIGYEGFLSDSAAIILSQIRATIDGVAPGTKVKIGYDWDYFATAVPDHEDVMEDPESAGGGAGFFDDQGTGPGNLFNTFVAEPGILTSIDADNGSYNLLTSNPKSYLDISLDGNSTITMDGPGNDPLDALQEDTAGSEFLGRLTLTLSLVVPEPASMTLGVMALVALLTVRRRA